MLRIGDKTKIENTHHALPEYDVLQNIEIGYYIC